MLSVKSNLIDKLLFYDILFLYMRCNDTKSVTQGGKDMKEYINRLKENGSKKHFIFWWIIRATLLFAFVKGFFPAAGEAFDITDPLQVGANFLCTFVWEIFMLFPEKSTLRHIPASVQSILSIGIWCGSFGGKFLNLYYDFRWWDVILHFVGGGACVFFGYEIVCAILKSRKATAPMTLVLLASVGFSFLAATGWELFEFGFDQIAGMMGGYPGDAQHWSLELALGTPKELTLFDPIVPERWPIMDTMADIVLNSVGALLSYIFIKFVPYRHKGKNALEFEKETATK